MKPQSMPISVALLDDHAVVRQGYERALEADPTLWVVGSYGSSAAFFDALASNLPVDVLILDYALNAREIDGVNLIAMLRARRPLMKILVASAYDNPATVALVERVGAHGFIGKGQPVSDIVPAIHQVARGERYFALPEGAPAHRPRRAAAAQTYRPEQGLEFVLKDLSPREQEVLRCFLDNLSVSDIAAKFSRSVKTISNQKQSAFKKLGIRSITELADLKGRLRGD
jgi:two-component system capsular synthesis response regulator RcsB